MQTRSGIQAVRTLYTIPTLKTPVDMLPKAMFYTEWGSYTSCLVHTLSSQNLPMLKGAYKYRRQKNSKKKIKSLYEEI
jgi:hypothetical protein